MDCLDPAHTEPFCVSPPCHLIFVKLSWSFDMLLFLTVCVRSLMTYSQRSAFVLGLCCQEVSCPSLCLFLFYHQVPFQKKTQKSTHIFEIRIKGLRDGVSEAQKFAFLGESCHIAWSPSTYLVLLPDTLPGHNLSLVTMCQ